MVPEEELADLSGHRAFWTSRPSAWRCSPRPTGSAHTPAGQSVAGQRDHFRPVPCRATVAGRDLSARRMGAGTCQGGRTSPGSRPRRVGDHGERARSAHGCLGGPTWRQGGPSARRWLRQGRGPRRAERGFRVRAAARVGCDRRYRGALPPGQLTLQPRGRASPAIRSGHRTPTWPSPCAKSSTNCTRLGCASSRRPSNDGHPSVASFTISPTSHGSPPEARSRPPGSISTRA